MTDNNVFLLLYIYLEALRSTGVCVKGKLLPDPESEALAHVDDTVTDNRLLVELQKWYILYIISAEVASFYLHITDVLCMYNLNIRLK